MDTFTLRKLQKFIEENNVIDQKKKRGAPSQGSGRSDDSMKKKKARSSGKEASKDKSSKSSQFAVRPATVDSIDNYALDESLLNEDSAELLFSHDEEDFSGTVRFSL